VFEGTRLRERGDVVAVIRNYWLNDFGFLHLARLDAADCAEPAMPGWDLVAALRWVHDTFAAFGSDPGTMTIFGPFGDGATVSTLMAMPQARGLLHKAMLQRGISAGCAEPGRGDEAYADGPRGHRGKNRRSCLGWPSCSRASWSRR